MGTIQIDPEYKCVGPTSYIIFSSPFLGTSSTRTTSPPSTPSAYLSHPSTPTTTPTATLGSLAEMSVSVAPFREALGASKVAETSDRRYYQSSNLSLTPAVVVKPETTEDVAATVKLIRQHSESKPAGADGSSHCRLLFRAELTHHLLLRLPPARILLPPPPSPH